MSRGVAADEAFILLRGMTRGARSCLVTFVARDGGAYLLTTSADTPPSAGRPTGQVIRLERDIGLFRELSIQATTLPYIGLMHLFNVIYFYGHFPLIIIVGAWLFWKHPPLYSLIRNSFLASGAIALVVFVLFPVAPPRLIGAGFIDTSSSPSPDLR
jgi:hypothetical protein